MKTLIKYLLIALVVALAVVLVLSQLQLLLLRSAGAIDGTFGVRPMSHRCLGLALEVINEEEEPEAPAGEDVIDEVLSLETGIGTDIDTETMPGTEESLGSEMESAPKAETPVEATDEMAVEEAPPVAEETVAAEPAAAAAPETAAELIVEEETPPVVEEAEEKEPAPEIDTDSEVTAELETTENEEPPVKEEQENV